MTEEQSSVPATMEIPTYRNWRFWAGCLISLAVLAALGYWAWNAFSAFPSDPVAQASQAATIIQPAAGNAAIPNVVSGSPYSARINRFVDPHTDIPDRGTAWVTEYTVQQGDTLSGIASDFNLTWESILFGNTDALKDDPNFLKPGQVLFILPVDGMFYKWGSKDSLESVAAEYNTTVEAIVDWPGNGLNPMDPVIPPGTWVILPGASRPFTWEAPMISTGGSTRTFALGPGTCPGKYNGVPGGEPWAWPTANRNLSGYDFGAGHPAIDIFVYLGQPIYAAQAGVVVFAGWSDRGYGDLVIVDHLNGWHTFYAHLSQWNVGCGQQVYTGTVVGLGGSTGNSTGPHLHFEMRYNGVGQNPWGLLP
jgi:murein DD-endopeptidase MepM/ murein hydrolase activator NlpD